MRHILVLIGIGLLLSACAMGHTYKEGLIVQGKRQLQEDLVKNIAKSSGNIIDYVGQIYTQPLEKEDVIGSDYLIIVDSFPYSRIDFNYLDTNFFEIYCSEKGGELFQWRVNRHNGYVFSGVRGVAKNLIACEKDSKIESALLYEAYESRNRDGNFLSYKQHKTYANESYIQKVFDENKLSGFISSNEVITFPVIKIDASYISDNYSVFFYYKNVTSEPQVINILNSYVMMRGSKYEVDFTYGREPIRWIFYNDQQSRGVFVGAEGKELTKLRLNPGQMLYGEFVFRIPGLTKIMEEDMESFVFQLDNIKCEKFKKISYYEKFKEKFKK